MRIKKLNYINKTFGWELDNIEFNKLTLFVGASGVGKTQILNAILDLKNITNGGPVGAVYWDVEFETINGNQYNWTGEFENYGFQNFISIDENLKNNKQKIISEKLFLNNENILERTKTETIFKNIPTLKLSQQESMISILKEEDEISEVFKGFNKLILSEPNLIKLFPIFRIDAHIYELLNKCKTIEQIQELNENIFVKLYLVSHNEIKTFNSIKERFCEIFPKVADIKIATLDIEKEEYLSIINDIPFIQIKEKDSENWIIHLSISSGMFKTLINICELYLCADGTVFLIDEFENSLGVNCIDEITNEVLNSGRNLQFIITSHHPYIINNIPFANWKLVTRNAGKVKAQKVDKFNIGKSHHDAFMQLLQLEEFLTGSE